MTDIVRANPTARIPKQMHRETIRLVQTSHHHHLISAENVLRGVQDSKCI